MRAKSSRKIAGPSIKKKKLEIRKWMTVFLILIFCFLLYVLSHRYLSPTRRDNDGSYQKNDMKERANAEYLASSFQNNPSIIENALIKEMRGGINDKYTKADIYFFVHRYFDNGGNIYEVSDYIEGHPEVSFLKEAEIIYPEIFESIRKRQLPFTYSDQGMYAFLAYLEIVEKYGYADVAAAGTAANQYAKMAFYKRMILQDQATGKSMNYPVFTPDEIARDMKKAVFFGNQADKLAASILGGRNGNTQPVDIVFGLNQYASALRYFDALGAEFVSAKSSEEIYSYAVNYSYHSVPEMYLSLSLTNATTLLLVDNTVAELRNAIYPFFDFKPASEMPNELVNKILNSRFAVSRSRFSDLDISSRQNIVELGNRVPEFKSWLKTNGWRNSDFR